jgi:redox-sensing transcriptional repressor
MKDENAPTKDESHLNFPLPTIRRYPIYLRTIHTMIAGGDLHISSAVLADKLGLDPVLTRKDLAMAGVPGKPRRGYPAKELAEAINRALGWDNATDAVLVGVGSLGRALLGYAGFEEQNLSIAVAFDAAPDMFGKTFHGVKVRAMEDLPRLVRRLSIKLAILTVPNAAAQDCAEQLIAAGIKGILNFTAIQLAVPADVTVQNVDIAQSLAVLSHSIVNTKKN